MLQADFSSGNLHDGKAAIPLLRGIDERLSLSTLRYQTMDTGYIYEPIYERVHRIGQRSIIAYYKNKGNPVGHCIFKQSNYEIDSMISN